MRKFSEKEHHHGTSSRCVPYKEAKRIISLFDMLDRYAGEVSGIVDEMTKSKEVVVSILDFRKRLRNWWYTNDASSFIDAFLKTEGKRLSEADRLLVLSWKKLIHGHFVCLKFDISYAVFVEINDPMKMYAVHALTDDFNVVFRKQPPHLVETALLPFNDIIIWDGIVSLYSMAFDNDIKKMLDEEAMTKKNDLRHSLT
jgi:hypothetical protein